MVKRFVSKDSKRTDEDPQLNDEDDETTQELLLLRRVRARMQQTQRNIIKLHNNLRFLKRWAIECLDIIDKAVDVIDHEGQENRRMIQMLHEPSTHSSSRRRRIQVSRASLGRIRTRLQNIDVDDISRDIEDLNSSWADDGVWSFEEENSNVHSSS